GGRIGFLNGSSGVGDRLAPDPGSVGDAAGAVVEFAGWSVWVDGGQRDGGVGAFGDRLVPAVAVEIGRGVAGVRDVHAHAGQVLRVLNGEGDDSSLGRRVRHGLHRVLVVLGVLEIAGP